jgi:uncharacterized protein (TIGR02594 family)
MASMIEVLETRIGTAEIKGPEHNPAILAMWMDAGHPEIQTDEEFWCSAAMCSAAKAAGLPMPPVNINPMARSWLTWGRKVEHADVERGDVVVWPRGAPGSSSGHVNAVADVRKLSGRTVVRCIGGNQSDPSGGAITLTDWTDIKGALPNGVRRPVKATVAALRAAGSTTIKSNDNLEKVGIIATFFTPIWEGVKNLFGPVEVPKFEDLPQGLAWWESLLGAVNAVGRYAMDQPVMVALVIGGLGLWTISRAAKAARVAEHAAGVPIAAEVAAVEA